MGGTTRERSRYPASPRSSPQRPGRPPCDLALNFLCFPGNGGAGDVAAQVSPIHCSAARAQTTSNSICQTQDICQLIQQRACVIPHHTVDGTSTRILILIRCQSDTLISNWTSYLKETLHGIVVLSIENVSSDVHPLVLDTMNLIIVGVEVSSDGFSYSVTPFYLGRVDPILGAPLTITLTRDANYVRIQYVTGTIAPALQWFAPGQTAGKIHPFMSTQSETIFARSWIPLQDSPQVRVTYHARVRVPTPFTCRNECGR